MLPKDTELRFPHIVFVEASAGSGKTYLLSLRFVQFLLSGKVPRSRLDNMLAITFTNNAAFEMKRRILGWLKKIALDKLNVNEKKSIEQVLADKSNLKQKSQDTIENILDNYHSFQVSTIDSFMTRLATASALELGISPDFEILMSKSTLTEEALYLYINSLSKDEILRLLELLRNEKSIDFSLIESLKKTVSKILSEVDSTYIHLVEPEKIQIEVEKYIKETLDKIEEILNQAKNQVTSSTLPDFNEILRYTEEGRIDKFPKAKNKRKNKLSPLEVELNRKIEELREYIKIKSELPRLKISSEIKKIIQTRLHAQGKIHIGEITGKLREYIRDENIPAIYFSLGERLYHFLIDEFQDTNSVQWHNLKILIEDSLSRGGSLFIVGDIKQAIYGFRGSDFTIMKNLKNDLNKGIISDFPSISEENVYRINLTNNFRSGGNIVEYVDRVFKNELGAFIEERGDPSGLLKYTQNALPERKEKGYVQTVHVNRDEIREKVLEIIKDAIDRGYRQSDIAILAYTNESVEEVSGWLTKEGYKVISESGTDIRTRKIIKEIEYLLKFLDSPIDNFSFAMFLQGDIAKKSLGNSAEILKQYNEEKYRNRHKKGQSLSPLYIFYKNNNSLFWSKFFEHLFGEVGYLSTYDLLLRIIETFDIHSNFPEETSAILKLLDVALHLEKQGKGSVKHLLELMENKEKNEALELNTSSIKEGIHAMTIYKAKGLEFNLVINIVNKKLTFYNSNFLFHHPVSDGVLFMRLRKDDFEEGTTLKSTYKRDSRKKEVEQINVQYVAMTRAKHELYNLVVITGEKKKPAISIHEAEIGEKSVPEQSVDKEITYISIKPNITLPKVADTNAFAWTTSRVYEARRGDFYHAIMSEIIYADDLTRIDSIIEKYKRLFKFSEEGIRERIIKTVDRLKEYFEQKEGRRIETEITFLDRHGNMLRMDRVVMDKDRITVIDYKTGHIGGADTYKEQITTYMNLLKDVYGNERVTGIIYNIDTGEYYDY